MKRRLLLVFALIGLAASTVSLQIAQPAFADSKSDVCSGVGAATGGSGCTSSGPTVTGVIHAVANTLSAIVGAVAVIMIIIAGFQYVTSNGDSGKIQSAKNALIYAIVGVAVVALAQAIVLFTVNKVTTAG